MTPTEALARIRTFQARRDSTAERLLERYVELRETLGIVAALEAAENEETERLVGLEEQRVEDGPWRHLQ